MQDAVADVLLERRALLPRRSRSVVVSLILHGLVALTLLIGSRRQPALPERTSVLNIRLAPQPLTATRPVAKPAPPPAEKPKPEEPRVVEKAPKKPVEKALFGKSPEKPVPSPKSPVPSPPARAVPGPVTRDPRRATTGVAGLEGGDFPFPVYIERMLTLIGRNWTRPQLQSEITAQVFFVIERDGRIRDVKLEDPSGNSVFDRAAVRAVMESSPLPPLPFAYADTFLGVHLTFH